MSDVRDVDLNEGDEVTITITTRRTKVQLHDTDDVYYSTVCPGELFILGEVAQPDSAFEIRQLTNLARRLGGTVAIERHFAAEPKWHSAQVIKAKVPLRGVVHLLRVPNEKAVPWTSSYGSSYNHDELSDVEVIVP